MNARNLLTVGLLFGSLLVSNFSSNCVAHEQELRNNKDMNDLCLYIKGKKVRCDVIEVAIQQDVLVILTEDESLHRYKIKDDKDFTFKYNKNEIRLMDKKIQIRKSQTTEWRYIDNDNGRDANKGLDLIDLENL